MGWPSDAEAGADADQIMKALVATREGGVSIVASSPMPTAKRGRPQIGKILYLPVYDITLPAIIEAATEPPSSQHSRPEF